MDQQEADEHAKILWDYMHMHHTLKKADCILVLGSYDRRVAQYAADLFLMGYAPFLLCSGGGTRKESKERFGKTEAETFADIALRAGVPQENIIVEKEAKNTVENIEFSKKLLKERGLDFQSFILVHKPSMERRVFATWKRWWPEKECIVTSPPISYEDFPNEEISKQLMIENIVGDFQRIKVYADRGWQIPQEVPTEVQQAFEKLIAAGYTQRLVQE